MHWIFRITLIVAIGLTAGCSKPQPTPEKIVRTYFDTMFQYTRDPDPWYQERAFDLLSQSTKATLEARATRFNQDRADGAPAFEAMHMLVPNHVRFGTTIESLERVEEGGERIVFKLKFERGTDTLVLVKEEEGWKIELPLPDAVS